MTETEKEQRRYALAISSGVCEVCGNIDHPLNIVIVCSLKCNQVCNIGYDEGACLRLVQRIVQRLMKRLKSLFNKL